MRCFCVYACVCVNFTYVRRQDVRCRCRQALGAACHLVNKQQLFDGGGGTDSCETGGTWQMDVLFHMCK